MAEKAPASTSRHEDSPTTSSEGFFGSINELNMRDKELQAEAYKNRLRDEALAGLDEYLAEAPEGTSREEAMAQIVSDLEAYDAKLGAMQEAGDEYATLESSIDQVDSSDRLDGIDRVIKDDPRLRRMNMMARDIAVLRAGGSSPEVSESIQAKEDKLNELLASYADADAANESVIDRIIERTVMGAENERPATTTERNLGEKAAAAAGVADPSEKTPTEPAETSATDKDEPKENEKEPTPRDAFYDREFEWMEAVEASTAKVTEDSKKRGYAAIQKRLMDSGLSEEDALRALDRARNAVIRKESSAGYTPETTPTDPTDGSEKGDTVPDASETEVISVDLTAEFRKIADLPNLAERMKASRKLRDSLVEEGKTPQEAAVLMDEARNAALDTKPAPATEGGKESESTPAADETAPTSSEDLPTDEELADHEEMEKQLREAGALKQPSARSIRRSTRKMRKKKAYQESYDMGFKTEGERMKKEKELFAKYRNEYFTAKGVKNSLLNRLRYRRGRDVK